MIAVVFLTLFLSSKGIRRVVPEAELLNDIEVWYINNGDRHDRDSCMKKQLETLGLIPHRFEAVRPTRTGLQNGGEFADCVKGGYLRDKAYVDATAGAPVYGGKTKLAIIGDTCSHKRLFQQLADSNSTAKYFLVLEDDAILNPQRLKSSLNQFVTEYNGPHAKDWQMVQMDFVGHFCKDQAVGEVGGKTVFKPKDIYKMGAEKDFGRDCARYWGSHALLMQKDQLSSVVEHLETHKTDAMDHVQGALPRALSWRPKIAGTGIRKFNELPDFCNKKMTKSSISNAFLQTSIRAHELA